MKTIKMRLYHRHKEYRAFSTDSYPPAEWEYIKEVEVEVPEKKTLYIYRNTLHSGENYHTYTHQTVNRNLEFVTKIEIEA